MESFEDYIEFRGKLAVGITLVLSLGKQGTIGEEREWIWVLEGTGFGFKPIIKWVDGVIVVRVFMDGGDITGIPPNSVIFNSYY